MRILYVSDVYFPRINGVSTSIRTFRHDLQALGHEITLVAPDYPQSATVDEPGIVRIAARTIPLDPEDRLMQSRALRRIPAHLGARTFDLVHIHTPFAAHYAGLRIARELGLPCVATYHTFFEEYLHHYVPLVPRALTRAIARGISRRQSNQVDALVVPSRAMLSTLTAYGVRSPMTILPTGISLAELKDGDGAAFRRRHDIPADRPVLVHVGRAAFEKNIEFLLRMLTRVRVRHPAVLLVIAGEGPALPGLQRATRRLQLDANVLFVGYLDRAGALLDCYCAGDAFVFASRTETQGLVLLEALALGVPVVALAEMGALDVLQPGGGALIAPPDEQGFADQASRVLDSPALRSQLAAAGRSHAAQWDSQRLAQRLVEFYAGVLKAHPASASARSTGAGPGARRANVTHL